jgi:23S rRNA-/tRNA-specific pseudouridylate synthase
MNDDDYLDWLHNPPAQKNPQRHLLHSHRLQFFHPILKTTCTLTAPLASDIAQFIDEVTTANKST